MTTSSLKQSVQNAAEAVLPFAKEYVKTAAPSVAYAAGTEASKAVASGVSAETVIKNTCAAAGTAAIEQGATFVVEKTLEKAVETGAKKIGYTMLEEGAKSASKQIAKKAGEEIVKQSIVQGAKQAALSSLKGNAVGAAAGFIVAQAKDTYHLVNGDIDSREYGTRSLENTGETVGGLGGAALGAAVGTLIFPGVGTAIGSFVGGMVGSIGTKKLAGKAIR